MPTQDSKASRRTLNVEGGETKSSKNYNVKGRK